MNHYMTKEICDRLYYIMRKKNVTSNYLCKVLNINYVDFFDGMTGKHPFYNKWQRKVADALGTTREELFPEFCSSNLRDRPTPQK